MRFRGSVLTDGGQYSFTIDPNLLSHTCSSPLALTTPPPCSIRFDKNKASRPWEVKLSFGGRDKSLGYFETKEEAGLMYDIGVLKYRG